MNERGFFTLMGLCFLIVVAVMARGVQESEGNYYSVTDDFVQAAELQNIADSALIEAVNSIDPDNVEKTLPKRTLPRYKGQRPIDVPNAVNLANDYDANVEVYAEYGKYTELVYNSETRTTEEKELGNIWLKRKVYPERDIVDRYLENNQREGVIIISVASRESDKTGGKIYRRAIAYFFTDDAKDKNIYFMNSLVEEK